MFIRELNKKVRLIPIKNVESDYEIRIIFNKGSNIECEMERGYIHLFEHIIILEEMMLYSGNLICSAVGYTDLDHMQIKFSCQSSTQFILLLNYINRVTEQIDIPDRIMRKAQNIVVNEINVKADQSREDKEKILFLSEGRFDLPIGKRENIVNINKAKFIKFINNYLYCTQVCLVIFSNLDNEEIFNYCKNVFVEKNYCKKNITITEPRLDERENQKLILKNPKKVDKTIYCLEVNNCKDIKNIMSQQIIELILKNIMKERKFTIGYKALTKEKIFMILNFENTKDIVYLVKNFSFSKDIFEKEKFQLKKQFLEIKKIGLNKWYILNEICKNFLYNMPIVDIEKIPRILEIIDNIFYEDVDIYFKNILKHNCKIIQYVGE